MKQELATDEEVNEYCKEAQLRQLELHYLTFVKNRYENNPTEYNEDAWLNYSQLIQERWNQHAVKKEQASKTEEA